MKPWKIIVILVAIIGVFAGVYFGISKSLEKQSAEKLLASGQGSFLEFSAEDIKTITFTTNEGTFDFSTEDGSNWTCNSQNMSVNSNNISLAISTMANLNTTKIIEENSANLSIYGLDNPITVSCSDGSKTYEIQIGNTSPTGESYYIKSTENNDVYTIAYSDGYSIHLEKSDLKNRFIIDSYVSTVNKVSYYEGDNVIFNCEKDDSGVWQLLEPQISNIGVDISKISSIVDLLIRADVIDFIVENPTDSQLAEYGLDNPKYTIKIGDDNEYRTVYFGNSPEDNVIYALFEDTKEVATFYMGEVGVLGGGTEMVLNNAIYNDKQENLTKISIDYNNQITEVGIIYDAENRKYSYSKDGKTYSEGDYYSLLNSLVVSSLNIPLYNMQLDAIPEGEPVLTITYTRTYEPIEYTLKFIPTDEEAKQYYVLMNDQYYGCVIRARSINVENQLISNLNAILQSKN